MAKKGEQRAAKGSGTIRKKTVTRSGKQYTYWEARVTVGRDPGTGKQVQRSFTGQTQREVLEKMKAASFEVSQGTYTAPCRISLGEWLDNWADTYLVNVKPRTVESYKCQIENHLKPGLGSVKLENLTPDMIQKFYNSLWRGAGNAGLSPKSVKVVHGVLHKALEQAVKSGYLRVNPSDKPELPKINTPEIHPLDEKDIGAFMEAIKGNRFEILFTVDLFTGLREGEILGLTWDRVDFERGTITVDRQLQLRRDGSRKYDLQTPKNGKGRVITPAPAIMNLLKHQKAQQAAQKLRAGAAWEDSKARFVFTDELGRHLAQGTVYHNFKRVAESIGRPDARFHDLRHSYAVASLRAGDDIKTLQKNLGHASVAFTLDKYGHVTEQMKAASAARMEGYMKDVLGL